MAYLKGFSKIHHGVELVRIFIFARNIFALLIISVAIHAENINFRKIDMNAGLSFNSVMCLMEDHDGFLWIGTREGLNKYDGYSFQIFKHNPYDTTSLSNNHINFIYQSSNKDIWVGTSNGLNRFNPATNSFTNYLAPPDLSGLSNNYVKSITEKSDGTLLIGTSNGITVHNPSTNEFEHLYIENPPTYANNIIALQKDGKERIWAGTKGGLFKWENKQFKRIIVDAQIEANNGLFEIRDIQQTNDSLLWIATELNGLYCIKYSEDSIATIGHWNQENSNILSNQVRKLLVENNRIWLATLSGLSIFDKSANSFTNISYSIEKPEGISRGSIHDILKDQFGGYWIATYSGGLNYYHQQNNLFDHYKRTAGVTQGLSENDVNGFLEDQDGNMWISTGRGLNYLNFSTGDFRYYSADEPGGLSNRIIKSMVSDKQGNLWIGTYNGLNYYDVVRERFKRFFHEPGNNSLNQNQVHALHLDEDGLLWIGMNVGEFQVYNPQTNTFEVIPNLGNIVSYIYEDSQSRIWIGTRSGLKCLDRITRKEINLSHITQGFEDELLFINWIMEDSRQRMWIGTQSSGLFLIKDEQLFWFGHGKGLNSNTVNAILEDQDGYLWISTNAGISKLEYLENNQEPRILATDFFQIHGLQGPQYNPASAYKNTAGMMFFGGINGFNVFYPPHIDKKTIFPKVIINKIQINTDQKNPQDTVNANFFHPSPDSIVKLKYDERNISVSFSGINYVNPAGTEYRYRLSGLEHGWINTGKQRTINFTYLPIGEHELELQASTNTLAWGDQRTILKIIVLPPWWLSNPAYISYILFFLLLLYLFFLYTQRWARLKSKLSMEQLIHEKEQKMYESKLEFFTDISHELRTPLTLILAPLEKIMKHPGMPDVLNTELRLIERNGRKMMELINQVLNLRRFESGQYGQLKTAQNDLICFLNEIALAFQPLANSREIEFTFEIEEESLKMWFDSNKLEIVVFNLLSNAFKHTAKKGKVQLISKRIPQKDLPESIQSRSDSGFVLIAVRDNGKGIPPAIINNLFNRFYSSNRVLGYNPTGIGIGLDLTKRMVDLHKGLIEVDSHTESTNSKPYTEFKVYLPIENQVDDSDLNPDENDDNHSLSSQPEVNFSETDFFTEDIAEISLPSISDSDKQTLLIVEDNQEVRQLIKRVFDHNYMVEEASDGHEGWEMALKSIPDLIISDIMMPGLNGIELCQKLKKDVRTSHIPVVLLTARATLTYKHQGFETGADAYITKPFSPDYLILRVKNLIKQRENVKSYLQREAILEPETVIINSVDDKLLKKSMSFIEEHMANNNLSIEQISSELGLSRMHYHRKIKSLTGMAPAEFVRSIRLKRAAAILKQNKTSVKETMGMVGFENGDHFRKCFKEQFGMTPSEYQNAR
jgi:ligand-binding sensor domain-containing protein/signal transduction histidine kinase/DNA-binding response OmpR family regulator